MAVVESVKAVSEIYAPFSGKVIEANEALEDHPQLVNREPYAGGWIVVLEVDNPEERKSLTDAGADRRHVGG